MTTNHTDLIIFCAEWCTACREFRILLEKNSTSAIPKFYWVDIENTEHMPDDLEIENLPSIAIIKNQHTLFFGAIEPRIGHLEALLRCPPADKVSKHDDALIVSIYQQIHTR